MRKPPARPSGALPCAGKVLSNLAPDYDDDGRANDDVDGSRISRDIGATM